MIELSKVSSSEVETPSKLVTYEIGGTKKYLFAGPAQFGRQLVDGFSVIFLWFSQIRWLRLYKEMLLF